MPKKAQAKLLTRSGYSKNFSKFSRNLEGTSHLSDVPGNRRGQVRGKGEQWGSESVSELMLITGGAESHEQWGQPFSARLISTISSPRLPYYSGKFLIEV